MGLTAKILAKTQQPTYRVMVNGSTGLIKVESIQIENDFDRSSASATITCAAKRGIYPNDEIVIYQGYSGFMVRTFTGYIDDVDKEAFPNKFVVSARDILKRAIDNYLVEEVEYDSVQAEDAVKDLLEKSGIYNYSLGTTNFTIGDVNPAKFSLISAMDAIKAIADLIGWRVWATKGGTVMFAKVYATPSISYKWVYTKDPTFGSQSGMVRVTHSFTDINLRNWVEVWGWTNPETGETIEAVASADSHFVPNPPRYRKCVISSEMIDTQAMADWIAARVLNDLNCLLERGEIEVQGNPQLNVGDTIRITEDWTDQSSGVNYFIYGLSSRMDGSSSYSMTLQVRGGKAAPPIPDGEPPIADLVIKQVGWGDPTWVVYADASGSYDPDGEIVSYDIDWGDASAHATAVRANHIYAGGEGTQYTITLTVTDDDGLTGTCAKTITIGQTDGGSIVYDRVLYFTTDNGGGGGLCYGSPDSGNTWYSYDPSSPVNCVSVQDNVEEGYAWFGCGNGKVYKTDDYCETATLVYTFGAAVCSIWIDRVFEDVIFVGLSDGKIYRTVDGGTVWTLLYTFDEGPIWNVFCEPGDIGHIHCSGGTTAGYWYESVDSGESWTDRAAGWTDIEVVRDHAWQFFQYYNAACQTDAGSIKRSEDDGITWVTGSGYTETLMRTISASPFDPEVVVAGGESVTTIWRTLTGDAYVDVGDVANGTMSTRLRFDGDLWGTIHGGTDDDLELSFDRGETWKQLKDITGTVFDIAQGPLIPQLGDKALWILGDDGFIYYSINGRTSIENSFDTSGLSNVGTPSRIVALKDDFETCYMASFDAGNSLVRIWKTTDGNASWSQVGTLSSTWMVKCFRIAPQNNNVMWVGLGNYTQYGGANDGKAFKSVNGGVDWTEKYSGYEVQSVDISPSNINRVIIFVSGSGNPISPILLSTNGGDDWSVVYSMAGSTIFKGLTEISFSPNGSNVIASQCNHFVGDDRQYVWVSTDAGDSFTLKFLESWWSPNLAHHPLFARFGSNSYTLWVYKPTHLTESDDNNPLMRSDDLGSSWTQKKVINPHVPVATVAFPDPKTAELIWYIQLGINKSDDNGETWEAKASLDGPKTIDASIGGYYIIYE